MKSKLIFISTKDMPPDQWLAYRKNGIGASDVSTVMGLNPYKSSIEYFYMQITPGIVHTIENMAMFMGKINEPTVAELWQYWEGTEESIWKNFAEGKIIRKCRKVNAYVNNPDYPWLFVSLDRVINSTATMPEGTLELKNMSGYEAAKWEHGIPPGYVVQVQTQTTVCEFIHGELATLTDGRKFDCLPFEHDSSISESIVRTTKGFWERVLEGRKIMTYLQEAKAEFNYRQAEKLEAELQQIEPEPDGSVAYMDFLKEKYKIADPGEKTGTQEQYETAVKHLELTKQVKELEERKVLFESQLKNVFRDEFDKMTFGEKGYVSWKTNKAGSRVFLNKVKI